jgi:hypothetical protein
MQIVGTVVIERDYAFRVTPGQSQLNAVQV